MGSGIFFQIQSTLILLLFFYGIFVVLKKKNRIFHAKIMSVAIIWDLVLIVQIELSRLAIEKAIKISTNPLILSIHVALALTTVILYLFMLYSGRKILKGNYDFKNRHGLMGKLTILLRIFTYFTSFWVV